MLVAWVLVMTLVQAEYYYEKEEIPEEQYHYYKYTDAEATVTPATVEEDTESAADTASPLRTLNHQELADVQDALKMLMANRDVKELLFSTTDADTPGSTELSTPWLTVPSNVLLSILEQLDDSDETSGKDIPTRSYLVSNPTPTKESKVAPTRSDQYSHWDPVDIRLEAEDSGGNNRTEYDATEPPTKFDTVTTTDAEDAVFAGNITLPELLIDKTDSMNNASESFEFEDTDNPARKFSPISTVESRRAMEDQKVWEKLINIGRQGPPENTTITPTTTPTTSSEFMTGPTTTAITSVTTTTTATTGSKDAESTTTTTTSKSRRRKSRTTKKRRTRSTRSFTYSTTTTKSRRKKTRYRTTTVTTTSPLLLDIPRLMELITNLTMDYSMNLTNLVNKTLQDVAMFTCPTMTTTTEGTTTVVTTTQDPYGNLTGTIMGKCFVCGLDEPAMPRHARCADAFSGDFIPLVPVEATARKMLASYRKYCRWMNVPKYVINETDPRSMWGRWTGGCSVRWIDISGIYTQRTCRNRHRAVMGRHWVSKRMAKLEMALQRVDNACIISPMSSLVPLSRGVSLYARFHVCVCTGSWCNQASPGPQCILHFVTTLMFMMFYIT